jgi:Tol biopolymer transport system component
VLLDRDQDPGSQSWSPDGTSIAFITSTDTRVCHENLMTKAEICDEMWDLHVMLLELDGSPPRELRSAGTCLCIGVGPDLTWSPDGRHLAIVRPDDLVVPGGGDFGLYVMDLDGTGLRRVFGGHAWGPAWQPVP